MPKPVKRQFEPAPKGSWACIILSSCSARSPGCAWKISTSDFHNRFSVAAQWLLTREEEREGEDTCQPLSKMGYTSGSRSRGRRIGGQTSERAKPRQMRHASVDNISTCGMRAKLSTGWADESNSKIRASRKRGREAEKERQREQSGQSRLVLCKVKYAKDKPSRLYDFSTCFYLTLTFTHSCCSSLVLCCCLLLLLFCQVRNTLECAELVRR